MRISLLCVLSLMLLASCGSRKSSQPKGLRLQQVSDEVEGNKTPDGVQLLAPLETRPSRVLQTAHPAHRLLTIYQVRYHPRTGNPYVGYNRFYRSYPGEFDQGQAWHRHFMPGFEALYGPQLLNIIHYDVVKEVQNDLFPHPVLIQTLYYPAPVQDTLNGQPITRDYYLVSVYDADHNQDTLINRKDLRRFYHFDLDGQKKTQLIPDEYSVLSSSYDPGNDLMFIFARLDENGNGQMENPEPVHVFRLDLADPGPAKRVYGSSP